MVQGKRGMMNELNTQFPGILLGYVSNVGYHLSSDECNELTKLWLHNEYNYDQLKAENERLREGLKKIYDLVNDSNTQYAVELVITIQDEVQQTLNEVTNE